MFTQLFLLLILAGPSPEPAQELPAYFIKFHQQRTLYAQNEAPVVTLRMGNQIEGILKQRKFPKILESLKVFKGDVELARNPKYKSKDLFRKVGSLGYGEHKDFRLNLRKYFPEIAKGGIYHVVYKDDNTDVSAKPISIVNIDMPDLKVDYRLRTSKGDITIRLDHVQVPAHARNFALLVATQFYRDMLFHRLVRNYVLQTGDPLGDGTGGSGFPVAMEKSPFLRHEKYAVGMARKSDPDSGDSQFYICLEPTKELDDGYAVIGKVIKGFDVVDTMGRARTTGPNGDPPNKPLEDLLLHTIEAVPRT